MAKAAGATSWPPPAATRKWLPAGRGRDVAVNYKTEDVAAASPRSLRAASNVYWETLREPDFDKIVGYLAERGRIIVMAGRDARPPFPLGPFYVKECSLHGLVMFKPRPTNCGPAPTDMNRWLAEGRLKAADRQGPAAGRNRRRTPAAGRQHPAQGRHAVRQDRVETRIGSLGAA